MDSLSIAQSSDAALGRPGKLLRRSLADHAWLLVYCLLYMAIAGGALLYGGHSQNFLVTAYALSTLIPPLAAVLFIAFGHLCQHALHVRPFSIGRAMRTIVGDERLTLRRAIYSAVPVILIPLFASIFTSFKNAIPAMVPFSYDVELMLLDRWLHLGSDPWRLLQPVFGNPLLTSGLSYLYNLWFPLMYLILYWQIFSLGRPRLRMQYLLSFALIWSLAGSLLALVFSSAGPVYFAEVTGTPGPYGALIDYLLEADRQYKNWSLEAQAYLWSSYSTGQVATGGGISAMPSLHVAVAVLQALLGWRVNRKLGLLLSLYVVVVLLGSVHLGWHYALDGYLSVALALIIWFASGAFLERRSRPTGPVAQAPTQPRLIH